MYHISGLVLALTSVLRVLNLKMAIAGLHHERHVAKRYVNYA